MRFINYIISVIIMLFYFSLLPFLGIKLLILIGFESTNATIIGIIAGVIYFFSAILKNIGVFPPFMSFISSIIHITFLFLLFHFLIVKLLIFISFEYINPTIIETIITIICFLIWLAWVIERSGVFYSLWIFIASAFLRSSNTNPDVIRKIDAGFIGIRMLETVIKNRPTKHKKVIKILRTYVSNNNISQDEPSWKQSHIVFAQKIIDRYKNEPPI